MANALYVDALKAYEFYLKQRGKATFDEINDYLIGQGRNPIAHRTYRHFHKLLIHGFRTYMSINKLDLVTSVDELQAAADRRKYHREEFRDDIEISKDGINWRDAVTTDRSLVGFGLITKEPFDVKPLSPGYLKIEGYRIIPMMFVWRKNFEKNTRLGIRAPEFIVNYRLAADEISVERLGGSIIIYRDREGTILWDSLYTALVKTNELLRGVTALLYTLEEALGTKIAIVPPILKRIEFSSPGKYEITPDILVSMVLDILSGLFDRIANYGLYKRKLRAEVQSLELDNAGKKINLVKESFLLGKEIRDSDIPNQAASALVTMLPFLFDTNRPSPKGIFAPDSPEMAILKNRIIPSVEGLLAGDDPEYIIKIKPPEKRQRRIR